MNILGMIPEQPPGWLSWMAALASAGGLPVALWQLWRTQKAADAARLAAVETRHRLRAYEAADNCTEAVQLLSEIRNFIDAERLDLLADRNRRARRLLIEIRRLMPGLSDNDQSELNAILGLVRNTGIRTQAHTWKTLTSNAREQTLAALEDAIDRLTEIKATLQRLQGERP